MLDNQLTFNELFDRSMLYPDIDAKDRLSRLIGMDEYKTRLTKMLSLMVNPEGLEEWRNNFHKDANKIIEFVLRRPPLIILSGDVGTGKTELAESIGDSVARNENINVTLLPLSLSTRGQGRVGEMTKLISTAFELTIRESKKFKSNSGSYRGAVILLIDEADALAQSREENQMHHEDKAGVNAFIRGVDMIGNSKLPVAIIMCTNRFRALDPAIRRRAAEIMTFSRPNDEQRHAVIAPPLEQVGFTDSHIKSLVKATGPSDKCKYGFTYSDLTQRLLPAIVFDAYPDKPIDASKALIIAEQIEPTLPFREKNS